MKIIRTRSPYIVSVNETNQTDAKIELRIWKSNSAKPVDATYTFTKSIPSTTKRELTFNISPFVKDVIENKIEDLPIPFTSTFETEYNYVNVELKTFYSTNGVNFTLIATEEMIGVNGYNDFVNGANQFQSANGVQDLNDINFDIFDTKIPIYYDRNKSSSYYIQLYIPNGSSYVIRYTTLSFNSQTLRSINGSGIFNIPITTNENKFNSGNMLIVTMIDQFNNYIDLGNYKIVPVCEPLFDPVICTFINKFGGIQQLTFFKVRVDTTESTSEKYNMMSSSWNYDPKDGIYKRYNFNAKDSIKLNTGFVPESYGDIIKDMMLSESIWIDGVPALVKTQSFEKKTQIRNKNISYDIEFEYAFDTINSVI